MIVAKGNTDNLKTAKQEGVSMAKAELIRQALQTTPEVTKENLKDKPIFVLKKITSADTPQKTKTEMVKLIKENNEKITRNKAAEIDRQTKRTNETDSGEKASFRTGQAEAGASDGPDAVLSPTPSPKVRSNRPTQKKQDKQDDAMLAEPAPTIMPGAVSDRGDKDEVPNKKTIKRGIMRQFQGAGKSQKPSERNFQKGNK